VPLRADQIAKLADRVRSPYRLGRRWAARRLARDAAPEAVGALADATAHATHDGVIAFAQAALAKRTDQPAIDAICRVWRDTRNYELGDLISRRGWSASGPPALRALVALHTNRLDPLAFETREAARALVEVADTEEPPIGTRAAEALTSLHQTAAREAVCQLAIEGGSPAALTAVLAAGYVPAEPADRALLLLLAGEYDRYAELDFDGSLLRAALAVAHQNVRTRLARQAGEAGRPEWVRAVARPKELAALTYGEWETAAAILRRTDQPEELWRLALQAPPVLSARILRELDPEWLLPVAGADQEYAARLLELAERCPAVVPTGAVFDEGPTIKGNRYMGLKFALSPDGELIATTDVDGVRLWQTSSGEQIGLVPSWQAIESLVFVPGTAMLAVAYRGSQVLQLVEVPSGAQVANRPGSAERMAVSSDGGLLGILNHGRVALRRLPDLDEIWSAYASGASKLAMTPDGSMLATADLGGQIGIWRPASGESPQTLWRIGGEVFDLVFTPDGGELIGIGGNSAEPTHRRFSLPSGTPLDPLPNSAHLRSLAVSPDGGLLFGGRFGREPYQPVRLWRLPSGECIGGLGQDPGGIFTPVAVSQDGSLVAADGWAELRSWRSVLVTLAKTPVARIDRADVDRVGTAAGLSAEERAWIELITVLKGWRHRHDIELSGGTGPGETDIELGPEVL
jgi:hypothetical protein